LKFLLSLTISLILAFFSHIAILNYLHTPILDNKIIAAYLVNFFLAIGIYYGLLLLKSKYNDQLGFLYMIGSFMKFIVFFLIFNPSYKLDGEMDSFEFAAFFIPYGISLLFETLGVIKFLKK